MENENGKKENSMETGCMEGLIGIVMWGLGRTTGIIKGVSRKWKENANYFGRVKV